MVSEAQCHLVTIYLSTPSPTTPPLPLGPGSLHYRHAVVVSHPLLEYAVLVSALALWPSVPSVYLQFKCDLLQEACLPWLSLLRETPNPVVVATLCRHLSQSVLLQLYLCLMALLFGLPWILASRPIRVSAVTYIATSHFWHLLKAENLTNLCGCHFAPI